MMSVGDASRFVVASGVAARSLDDYAVAVQVDKGIVYTTAGIGHCIWELLASGRSVGDIVTLIGERYPREKPRVRQDVIAFVESLLEAGLIIGR